MHIRGAKGDVWQLARAGTLGEGHVRDLGLDSKDSEDLSTQEFRVGAPPHPPPWVGGT